MHKLISDPTQIGMDEAECLQNFKGLVDIREDVIRDLMQTPHAIERRTLNETGDIHAEHPRHRTCL